MSTKLFVALAAVLIAAAAFGAGYSAGRAGTIPEAVFTADCHTGGAVASCQVGDTWYGFRDSVSWTDSAGVGHENGWPSCLPQLQDVRGVRFAGAMLQLGNTREARIVWVDCQSH